MGGDESSDSSKKQNNVISKGKEDEIMEMPSARDDLVSSERSLDVENFDAALPSTVTLLHGKNGAKLYLVGTAHFSLQSQEDVSNVIRTVKPHIVVVELCESRSNILRMDEKTIEEEVTNLTLAKMKKIVKENGFIQGMMNIILLSVSAQLTRDLGMAPGGEFRRAFKEVKRLPGCLLHFGDRPIHITLNRAFSVLSWWQRLRIAWSLLFQNSHVTQKDIEKFKESDLLSSMLRQMSIEFPQLGEVFIDERDMYLTYSLQFAASCSFYNQRNDLEKTVAVGVVGIGHTPGIKKLWGQVTEEDIQPIMKIHERKSRGLLKKSIGIGLLLFIGYKLRRKLNFGGLLSQFTSSFKK